MGLHMHIQCPNVVLTVYSTQYIVRVYCFAASIQEISVFYISGIHSQLNSTKKR